MVEQIKYCKEGARNYLILPCRGEAEKGFQAKMLERNILSHFLLCKVRYLDGQIYFYYDISSKISVKNYRNGNLWNGVELKKLVDTLADAQRELEKYLLDDSGMLLNSETIFYDYETEKYYFLYYPSEKGVENVYNQLFEYLLDNLETGDEAVTDIMYELFEEAERGVLSVSRLQKKLEECLNEGLSGERIESSYREEQKTAGAFAYEKIPSCASEYEKKASCAPAYEKMPETDLLSENTQQRESELQLQEKEDKITGGFGMVTYVVLILLSLLGEVGVGVTLCFFQCSSAEQNILAAVAIALGVLIFVGIKYALKEKAFQKRKAQYNRELTAYREQEFQAVEQPSLREVSMEDFLYRGNFPGKENAESGETVFFATEQTYEYKLYATDKKNKVHIPLQKMPCTVGKARGMVDYCIQDASVSRMHARIECRDGHYILSDLNSTNGTYLNGMLLGPNEQVEIEPGDEIKFGKMRYSFR